MEFGVQLCTAQQWDIINNEDVDSASAPAPPTANRIVTIVIHKQCKRNNRFYFQLIAFACNIWIKWHVVCYVCHLNINPLCKQIDRVFLRTLEFQLLSNVVLYTRQPLVCRLKKKKNERFFVCWFSGTSIVSRKLENKEISL